MPKQKIITPIGVVKFPSIGKPNKKGKYDISLVLDSNTKEFKDMVAIIDDAEKDYDKKFRGKPQFKKNYDIVDGEKKETDKVIMRFNSAFPLWDDEGSKIFDAKGKPVKTDIGWGSKCRVSFVLSPYEADGNVGITRYISGIQIIDLKLPGVSADACGFKEEEGFVAQESKEASAGDFYQPEKEEKWEDEL